MYEIITKFSKMKIKNEQIIICQKIIRGWLIRNRNKKQKDNMTIDIVQKILKNYNKNYKFNKKINKSLSKKKLRNNNFPSEISENLVKFAIFKKYKIFPTWDTKIGDLQLCNIKIEVKGFMSNGPSSFGPTEKWRILYFVDCKDHMKMSFKIYEIFLSNDSEIWKNIKINKTQTYECQCKEKRRPRICFKDIKTQIPSHCKLIFSGNIKELY